MQAMYDPASKGQTILATMAGKLGYHLITNEYEIDEHQPLLLQVDAQENWRQIQLKFLRVAKRQKSIVWFHDYACIRKHLTYLLPWLKHWQVVVRSQRVKDDLIQHGLAAAQIKVAPFSLLVPQWHAEHLPELNQRIISWKKEIDSPNLKTLLANQLGGLLPIANDPYQIPAEYNIAMAAGIPALVDNGTPLADLVRQNGTGLNYANQQELYEKVKQLNEQSYQQMAQKALTLSATINQRIDAQHALIRATHDVMMMHDYSNDHPRYGIHVMNNSATLDYIAQHHCSVSRLGDGEISLLLGTSQVFQDTDPELQKRLAEIVKTPSSDRLLVCLSDTFHDLGRYVPKAQDWWNGHLNVFHDYYQELGKLGLQYGNTMVTRPYMDLQDRTHAGEVFARIKEWWQDRDLLIVEGALTRSGIGNDLYDNARSVQRIICPPKNAWGKYQEIEQAIKQYGQGKLVLVMLGMAATVIAADLADWGQVIDSGHLDPEYEWYKMGATKRVPIQGKHTAEMNYDQGVPQTIDDPKYHEQIILDLTK